MAGESGCVIPVHREIAAGTLRAALKLAAVTLEDFTGALS